MLLILFLIFVITPIIEITLFIQIGAMIGVWATLAIVILTALLGSILLRAQGLNVVTRTRHSLAAGELPVEPVIDAFALVIAGALLLTPGFLTDAVGLLLFVPPVRRYVAGWMFKRMMASGRIRVFDTRREDRADPRADKRPHQPGSGRRDSAPGRTSTSDVIDVEFEHVDEPDPASGPQTGQRTAKGAGAEKRGQPDDPGPANDDSPWRR